MNLAVHGLEGRSNQSNSYYENPFPPSAGSTRHSNPPFQRGRIGKAQARRRPTRYPFDLPRADNSNYVWIESSQHYPVADVQS